MASLKTPISRAYGSCLCGPEDLRDHNPGLDLAFFGSSAGQNSGKKIETFLKCQKSRHLEEIGLEMKILRNCEV